MTTNERLIRNLCRARLEELKERATIARQGIKTEIAVSDLHPTHRKALIRLRTAAVEKAAAKRAFNALGYSVYDSDDYDKPAISRPRPVVEREQQAVNEASRRAREALEKLQSEAIVATLGQPPEKAQPLLQKLLKDLKAL